jgi:tetratricopeptide (TPR) repeat protein
MAEVARQLSERGQLDAALSLRIRSRALLETQLAREPENAAVQSALADLLLESTDASWTVLSPAEMTSRGGATLKSLDDRSILASGLSPDTDVYTVTVTDLPARFRALRLEVLPYESPTHQGPGRALNGNFVLSEFSAKLHTTEPDAEQALLMTKAIATYEQAPNPYDGRAYPIVAVLDGNEKEGGWAIWPRVGQSHSAVFSFQNVVEGKTGASLTVSLFQNLSGSHQIGRFRISVTESPVAILQTAVSGLTDSRTKLAAAYLLAGDFDPAGLLLETSPVQAKELIDTWISSGVAVDGVLDLLKSRAPDVCVAVLPEAAGHAAEKGEMEAARLMYSRLIELKPENSLWKERLAQLQPGTVALWNFDTGLGTWGEGRNCKLAVRDGVLQVTETSADPHFFGPIAASVGANVLALRYRREQSFWMEYFCGDARGDVYQSTGTRIDHVSGTEGAWRELLLPLSYKGPLNALRLDLNLGTGQTVEIDSIELRQVDATEYARLAREMVVEPTLARLKAEIDQEPQSSAKYSARATYLMQLGRWREAAEDMMQERKLTPADRVLWFREANCRLLAGDVAGYRKLCQGMIEQFRGTTDPQIADSVCKTCLLQPGAVELSDLPIPFLRNATVDPEQAGNIKWFVGCCALISYREGNYAEAVAWTLKDPEPDWQPGALTLVVRALAEHQLGQHEQARRTLAAADALIPVELHTLGMADAMVRFLVPSSIIADDWLAPEILRREARALIEPGTADPLPPAIRAP